MDRVSVRRDAPYRDAGEHGLCTFDSYYPADAGTTPAPAVIFVTGYSDLRSREMLGCKLKEMAAYVCWARLVACHGMVAITYASEDPVADVRLLLEHVRRNAASLRVDAARLGVWSCSGNVPNALALLADDAELRCAALCYGYMLDEAGCREVAEGAATFGFVNPTSGVRAATVADVPMLIARAGKDETPGLNASLDRFVTRALAENLPLTVVNHPEGPHAFDIFDRSARSRAVIRQVLGFLQANLWSASP
jgi:dienelactone hydrolase